MTKIDTIQESQDGTVKFLIELHDKNKIETVILKMKNKSTVCISSQVGCAMGCSFCFTGKMGLIRNLTAQEIVSQVDLAKEFIKSNSMFPLRNIVFMGQGEPLHNFDEVKLAVKTLKDPKGHNIGSRSITISTSGLAGRLSQLDDLPDVHWAISLHAANNELRNQLMPINRANDLGKLFSAIKSIPLKNHRRILFEYVLIEGINDSIQDIAALENLLTPKVSKINIIPYNPFPNSPFKSPTREKVIWFQEELLKRNFSTRIRSTKGDDILAACGQLANKKGRPEDLPI